MYTTTLLALAVAGGYCLHYIGQTNGFYGLIAKGVESRMMTDFVTPWPSWLQGPEAIVLMGGNLLNFFWPVLNGDLASTSWQAVPFAGQVLPCFLVVVLEGYRRGLQGKAASYTTVYGQLMQLGGFALIAPLYLWLNLINSPFTTTPTAANVAVTDDRYIKALPWALTTGYILPTLLMALPYPGVWQTVDSKVVAILVWQAFPITVMISMWIFTPFFASTNSGSSLPSSQLPLLRRAYVFAMVPAAISHVATLTISVTSWLVPVLFNARFVNQLSPWTLLAPSLSTETISSVAEGALGLLKWDYTIGSVAHLVWAYALVAPVQARGKGLSDFSTGSVVLDIVLRTVVLGPMCTVVTLIWERDEIVLGGGHEKTN